MTKKSLNFGILIPLALLVITFSACGGQSENPASMESRVDTLTKQMAQAYKPGLGEFMLNLQIHHAKIWFAGKNQNWDLAIFEVGEMKETIEHIKKYCDDRPEIKSLPILYPDLDSVNYAISAKNLPQFQKSFVLLTNSCNICHQSTHYSFNVIKLPDMPPFTNQDFKAK